MSANGAAAGASTTARLRADSIPAGAVAAAREFVHVIARVGVAVRVDPGAIALVNQVAQALTAANLEDTLEDLADRLAVSGRVVETRVHAGVVRSSLSPFAELILREAIDAARLDSATASRRIARALEQGGF